MAYARWRKPALIGPLGELSPEERAMRALNASLAAVRRWERDKAKWTPERWAKYNAREKQREQRRKAQEERIWPQDLRWK